MSVGPWYHGVFSERVTTLSPLSAEIGMTSRSGMLSLVANERELLVDLLVDLLVPVDEVHLVDGEHEVGHPEQGQQHRVPARLLGQALAGVDEHEAEVGGRGAGDHVAGVLDVARGVGDDELAVGRREVAVGHVDGDALLALGAQTVGQQGQVGVVVAAGVAGRLDGLELVLEDRLGVEQQPPDEGRLAVVDGAGGRESEQVHRGRAAKSVLASEVAFLLPVLHGGLGEPVVTTGRAALGDAGDGDLVDDLVDRVGLGLDATGQGEVADGAEPHGALLDGLVALGGVVLAR